MCVRADARSSVKMGLDTLLMVIAFVICIDYSQQLLAQKCHYRRNLFYPVKHCGKDLRKPRCETGVIAVQWVKHENDNCNWRCKSTCCVSIDDYASNYIKRKVIQECDNEESCNLNSITFGMAIVGYTCEELPATSPNSTTTLATPLITVTTATPAPGTTTMTVSWIAASDKTSPSLNTSESGSKKMSRKDEDKADNDDDIQIEVVIVLAVIAAVCIASIPAAVILCRRHANRKHQKKTNELELDASPFTSHSQIVSTREEDNDPSNFLNDNVPITASQQVSATGNEYNTTAEVLANGRADNTYDHIDHRKGKFTGTTVVEGSSAHTMDNVYDHTDTHFMIEKSTHNMDNVYDTTHDTSVVAAKLGNSIDNVYDTTKSANQAVVEQPSNRMDNVYDTTQKSGTNSAYDGGDMYDTTQGTFQELQGNADNTYGNIRDTEERALEHPNGIEASVREESNVYDNCPYEVATETNVKYNAGPRGEIVQGSSAVNGALFNEDTYANLS